MRVAIAAFGWLIAVIGMIIHIIDVYFGFWGPSNTVTGEELSTKPFKGGCMSDEHIGLPALPYPDESDVTSVYEELKSHRKKRDL